MNREALAAESQASLVHSNPGIAHTLGLLAIIGIMTGLSFIAAERNRASLRVPRSLLYLEAATEEWLIVVYVWWGVRRQGGSLGQLIGGNWSRAKYVGRDLLLAIALYVCAVICMAVLALAMQFRPGVESTRFMRPHNTEETIFWLPLAFTAGFCEEIIFRGYLQAQLIRLFRSPAVGILISAVIFGACHVYQGGQWALLLGVYGAILGVFAFWRRNLRPGMIAHATQDTLAGLAFRFISR